MSPLGLEAAFHMAPGVTGDLSEWTRLGTCTATWSQPEEAQGGPTQGA